MNPERPSHDWASRQARSLLDRARAVRPWSAQSQALLRERLRRDRARPAGALRPALAFAAAAAALALGFGLWPSTPKAPEAPAPRFLAVGDDVALEVSAEAAVEVLTPGAAEPAGSGTRQVLLLAGELGARVQKQPAGHRFAVVTPHVRVVVVGTRFAVRVDPDWTQVSVEEGRVRVESAAGASVELGPGERIRSSDLRLLAPPPPAANSVAVASPAASTCDATGDEEERLACYQKLAEGQGLAAQNALFLLGLTAERRGDLEGAVARWQELDRRFVESALGPEALFGSLRALVQLRRLDEAAATARAFRERFGAETRLPEVALIEARLLCSRRPLEQVPEDVFALAAAPGAPAEIHEEALFGLGACQKSAARRDSARESFQRYLEQFPRGIHAAEARRALDLP